MRSGYRGFLREFTRTGSWRALSLQLRTGAAHVVRQLFLRRRGDPVAQFLAHYGADGVRAPDAAARALQLDASHCIVCGLCSQECARIGGAPPLDPRDAVIAASRLETDLLREDLASALALGAKNADASTSASACRECDACSRVCPALIPIARVQQRLASLQ
jgi:succinate dehydrogenase/fumarate reductase-like Fe-S protein